jgi:hypothetical protein
MRPCSVSTTKGRAGSFATSTSNSPLRNASKRCWPSNNGTTRLRAFRVSALPSAKVKSRRSPVPVDNSPASGSQP